MYRFGVLASSAGNIICYVMFANSWCMTKSGMTPFSQYRLLIRRQEPDGVNWELEFAYFSLGKWDTGPETGNHKHKNGNGMKIWVKKQAGKLDQYPLTPLEPSIV